MEPSGEELTIGRQAYFEIRKLDDPTLKKYLRSGALIPVIGGSVFFFTLTYMASDWKFAALIGLLMGVAIMFQQWFVEKLNEERCRGYRLLLKLLEEKYGDTLPWVKEEKVLAQAARLEVAISVKGTPSAA